jgi:hypothetical protein
MEGDGPCFSMILYKYQRLIASLEKRKQLPKFTVLKTMFDPMIAIAKKYCLLSLSCSSIVLATVVHPAWRLSLINNKYPEWSKVAEELLQSAFRDKLKVHSEKNPVTTTHVLSGEDSNANGGRYYPKKRSVSQEEEEMKKYHGGAWPMGRKGNPLEWWKVKYSALLILLEKITQRLTINCLHLQSHSSELPILAMVARDVLSCAGSSSTVKRTFSAAADVCAPGRSSLALATIERCVSSHMWFLQGFKAGGEFTDCQAVVDEAKLKKKFATHVENQQTKVQSQKIKNVSETHK